MTRLDHNSVSFCFFAAPGGSNMAGSSPRTQQSPQHRANPSSQYNTNKSASHAKEEQRRWVELNVDLSHKKPNWGS